MRGYWAGNRVFGHVLLLLLLSAVFVNSKAHAARIKSSGAAGRVALIEYVPVGEDSRKPENFLTIPHSPQNCSVKQVYKSLKNKDVLLPRPKNCVNYADLGGPQRSNTCEFKFSGNIDGAGTSKISNRQLKPAVREDVGLRGYLRQMQQNFSPLGFFNCFPSELGASVGRVGTLFGSIDGILRNFDVSPHPFFLSEDRRSLQRADYKQQASEYYEQGVVYFLYSLCPVLFLMIVGGYLTLNGSDLFNDRFGVRLSRFCSGLVYGGFLYLFLGTLFVGSGLLL